MSDTLEALREGNHEAFIRLFDTWYLPLCRYACSILRDMDESEEVVQKVFCKLWDQHQLINIQSSVSSYLYRMVHNSSLNTLHRQVLHQEHNLNYLKKKDESTDEVADELVARELQEAIYQALEKLPPQCRRVFELSRYEQMSYATIAAELSISVNTVENHMAKALRILRIELKEFLTFLLLVELLK